MANKKPHDAMKELIREKERIQNIIDLIGQETILIIGCSAENCLEFENYVFDDSPLSAEGLSKAQFAERLLVQGWRLLNNGEDIYCPACTRKNKI